VSEAKKSAAIQRAERLLKPKPPEPTYNEVTAELENRRRAENEKTARLRALRLAKEAAEAAKEGERNAPRSKRGKRRE